MASSSHTLLAALVLAASLSAQEPKVQLALREFTLELEAHWERLEDTTYGFEKRYPLIRDLAPAMPKASYDAAAFRAFLPESAVAVGESWAVDVHAVLPFLRQFHPGARAELHHDHGMGVSAHGAYACLRALDETRAEILLRAHAEFLLDGDGEPSSSSWFTPAQFRGLLVLDRRTGTVSYFQLGVPPRRANVDINIAVDGGISADIGKIPRMELVGGQALSNGARGAIGAHATQIGEREAEQILERRFYPFAAVEWLDLAAARRESLATKKPLHVVELFGALTDESC